ncbi:MAG: precorrin-6A reductase [Leptolyngbyaceae cyanobacterium]
MSQRLWLIGGTQESRQIIEQVYILRGDRVPLRAAIITVTTAAARSLYPTSPNWQVWVGRLTAAMAERFVARYQIGSILDVSHPFATEISELAIAIARRHDLPYLRYERADCPPQAWRDRQGRLGLVRLPQVQAILTDRYLEGETTLLILGYRLLPQFAAWQQQSGKLYARILPSLPALTTALESGFSPDRLIALRPPLNPALETALWQQWQITQVIAKASGSPGGQDHKQAIAAQLGIRLIQIERPPVQYPQQTDCLDTAVRFALRYVT